MKEPQINGNEPNNNNLENQIYENEQKNNNIEENQNNDINDTSIPNMTIVSNDNNNSNINNNNEINNNNLINDSNIESQSNNEEINIPSVNQQDEKYIPKFCLSFKILFILNSMGFFYSFKNSFDVKNYILSVWPIIYKEQFYRIIFCYFFYQNTFDFIISIISLFFITKYLELSIGTVYTIIITFIGMIITSIIYVLFMIIFKIIFRYGEFYLTGFSGSITIFYNLSIVYYLLKSNRDANFNFGFFDIKGLYFMFYLASFHQFISPSGILILNICGAFSSYLIIKQIGYFILPRNIWVKKFELILRLNKDNKCDFKNYLGYHSISENDNIINNIRDLAGNIVLLEE
jgi:membrane associated rhomboid family serine protease